MTRGTTRISVKKGAVEIRRLWVRKWAAEYVREQLGVPSCRSVIRLDKEIRHPEKSVSFETRYYMSSLDPDVVSAEEFQAIILGHGRWRIVYTCLRIAIAARTSRSVVLIGERCGRCC